MIPCGYDNKRFRVKIRLRVMVKVMFMVGVSVKVKVKVKVRVNGKLGLGSANVEVLLNTIGFYLQYRFLVHIEHDLMPFVCVLCIRASIRHFFSSHAESCR